MKRILLSISFILSISYLFAQSTFTFNKQINWADAPIIHNPYEIDNPLEIYSFEGARYKDDHPSLPMASHRQEVSSKGKLSVEIINVQYETLDKKPTLDDDFIKNEIVFDKKIYQNRKQYFANISYIPIIKSSTGEFQKVTNIELKVTFKPNPPSSTIFRGPNTFTSVLADGDIYRIQVNQNGIHKLTYDFLKNDLGIENIDNIDPRNIQVYGNGGGMLPELVSTPRYDDLEENAVFVNGEADGSFDNNDYILFYGEGADEWIYDTSSELFKYKKNFYANSKFYFIKIGTENGKRVSNQASIANTAYTTNSFDAYQHFEEDKVNLLHDFSGAQGSGKEWYGDAFALVNERVYNNLFTFNNLVPGEDVILNGNFAGRSSTSTQFRVNVDNNQFTTSTMNAVSLGNGESLYASIGTFVESFQPTDSNFDFTVTYTGTGESEGWINFLTMNARRQLQMVGSQLRFVDKKTLTQPSSTFELSNANGITIWDISNAQNPKVQETTDGNTTSFGVETTDLKYFIAFNSSDDLLTAEARGKMENQNIHGLDNVDMVVIYANGYEEPVNRFVEHRASHSNMIVEAVRLDHIYNEFSGGTPDVTAIRDFAVMLHERSDNFKFMLLFGDGSFDYKNIRELNISSDGENNHHIIPPYETNLTLHPITAYPSDDFFGLLSEGEGTSNLTGELDIAVGRFPIKNLTEANAVVDKIINYDTSPNTLGDWRIRLAFVGDNGDGSIHTKQADGVSELVSDEHIMYNHDKIYFDAFQQIATPGGQRFPDATEAINQNVFKGVLALNYLGHGGGSGWAQERVLRQQHIVDWENYDKLPIMVTATCSFTGYDEPNYESAGELSFLNEKGGMIGLYTTVRSVFSSQNEALTRATFRNIFDRVDGEVFTTGDILRNAKNEVGGQNTRKFALIGDPSLKLAIPKYNVTTTKINDSVVTTTSIDTIQALQKVTIEGQIEDFDGNLLTDFNGKIFPTIFDKPIKAYTLNQTPDSPEFEFDVQKNVIFKGVASVINGKFEYTFVVPKDINYAFGEGKISYYAHDGVAYDAAGAYDKIIIGGTDPNAVADDQPPLVEVYMNSEEFVFGGITDENPVLLVKLSDDNGINVVGNSIGHDLTGVLDENTQNTLVLNDFYESELDNYTKGTVRFPLFNLEEGKHQIKVRAWDIANNSSEGYTEFIVAKSAVVALDNVLNYPNPFTDNTSFEFEHNLPNQLVDIQIRIFSVSGNLVKTIQEQIMTEGNRTTGINWNGTDEYGDQLARGVYLYKVKVGGSNSSGDSINSESEFEKLVILK